MRQRPGRRAGPHTCTIGEMRGDRPPSTSCSASECAMRSSCALPRKLSTYHFHDEYIIICNYLWAPPEHLVRIRAQAGPQRLNDIHATLRRSCCSPHSNQVCCYFAAAWLPAAWAPPDAAPHQQTCQRGSDAMSWQTCLTVNASFEPRRGLRAPAACCRPRAPTGRGRPA